MTQVATFAAGCFWGVEHAFAQLPGVVDTTVGYTGGDPRYPHPGYQQVCTGVTDHAEAVRVEFDPARTTFAALLDAFWKCHDPTTRDRQGSDIGSQYRSAIFYHDDEQRAAAEASRDAVQARLGVQRGARQVVTEIVAAGEFYRAEDYHQEYFKKNGATGCRR